MAVAADPYPSLSTPKALRTPRRAQPAPAAQAVVDCYDVLDLCRGCGITDFTDGRYASSRNDTAGYVDAQRRQAEYLLDQIECGPGMRILDIGCGYGRVLEAAAARGAEAIGITISPPQAANNRRRGLEVYLTNYREIFTSGSYDGWAGAFDGVIANGSLEHFVQVEDAAAGRADAMYREFFDICHTLLHRGGRLATTAIHARRVGQVNPADLLAGPNHWPRGSETYHAANLHRSFGGWYPEPGQLERCASGAFAVTQAEDGTHDYLMTSEYWVQQIRRSLLARPSSWPLALRTFAKKPRAAWQMLQCLLVDQSWNYQFRPAADGGLSPAQLWRQTWTAL